MSKEKLQVCVSFKNTDEEQDLYMFTLGQSDKSAFIKNLIRQHMNGDAMVQHTKPLNVEPKDNKIAHGKKTRSKFLA